VFTVKEQRYPKKNDEKIGRLFGIAIEKNTYEYIIYFGDNFDTEYKNVSVAKVSNNVFLRRL